MRPLNNDLVVVVGPLLVFLCIAVSPQLSILPSGVYARLWRQKPRCLAG